MLWPCVFHRFFPSLKSIAEGLCEVSKRRQLVVKEFLTNAATKVCFQPLTNNTSNTVEVVEELETDIQKSKIIGPCSSLAAYQSNGEGINFSDFLILLAKLLIGPERAVFLRLLFRSRHTIQAEDTNLWLARSDIAQDDPFSLSN